MPNGAAGSPPAGPSSHPSGGSPPDVVGSPPGDEGGSPPVPASVLKARNRLNKWRDMLPDERKGRPALDRALFGALEQHFVELDNLNKTVEALEFQLANVLLRQHQLEEEILSVSSGLQEE